MTHPGIGPVNALAFVLTIGPVTCFRRSEQLATYLGLNPSEHSSGEREGWEPSAGRETPRCAGCWSRRSIVSCVLAPNSG